MTPQLQQAIRLLQLSTLDLRQEIQQAVESNPLLELEDGDLEDQLPDDDDAELAEVTGDAPETLAELDSGVDTEWDDIYTESPGAGASSEEYDPWEERTASTESLSEHLLWQLNLAVMTDADRAIAYAIIDALDQRGYLTSSLADIAAATRQLLGEYRPDEHFHEESLPEESLSEEGFTEESLPEDGLLEEGLPQVFPNEGSPNEDFPNEGFPNEDFPNEGFPDEGFPEEDEVLAVLRRVQHFDPPGIAARDLAECLAIQLRQLPAATPWRDEALALTAHLPLLEARELPALRRQLGVNEDGLVAALQLLRTLTPSPADQIGNDEPDYIVPDVIVRRRGQRWLVELNADALPKVRLNRHYENLAGHARRDEDNQYLRTQVQEARWFLKSLQSRNETLLKVATRIVEVQRDFFEYGDEAMKPLVLADIASAVEMHESTISRVTNQKFMFTPRGMFELKFFFSSHVGTDGGGECSSTAIRAIIKKLIAAENPRKPLSDSRLASLLNDQGIQVARRTVAKYREAMKIPASSERKRLL